MVTSGRYAHSMENTVESRRHSTGAIEQMLRRIQCEFLEMPGLRVTIPQAQRLWDLDACVCESLLAALVDVQFLVRTVDGAFMRSTDTVSRSSRGDRASAVSS